MNVRIILGTRPETLRISSVIEKIDRVCDHIPVHSDVLLPYTERSRANLIREGILGERILVNGNSIHYVVNDYLPKIDKSGILDKLAITKGKYFLVTIHRIENVDIEVRLRQLITALIALRTHYDIPVICSLHPRTKDKIHHFIIDMDPSLIQFHQPFGFFDFIRLEQDALCVLSDSGTVQEECCIFRVPNVTLRDVTERPETIECGSNVLSGADEDTIVRCVRVVLTQTPEWNVPVEYLNEHVSKTIVKILLGFHIGSGINN